MRDLSQLKDRDRLRAALLSSVSHDLRTPLTAILGGLDSIAGVILAGIIVGVCEGLASGLLDPLVGGGTRDVVASVIILATLLVRPEGLFGREHIQRI